VVSAVALEPETLSGIAAAIGKRLNKPVQLKQKTDSALIAGMRVTVGGITYDGSVKGKLDKWSEQN
jgi:F0F1-type ATP synthase delta subunit